MFNGVEGENADKDGGLAQDTINPTGENFMIVRDIFVKDKEVL